jgi:hypothetical protein
MEHSRARFAVLDAKSLCVRVGKNRLLRLFNRHRGSPRNFDLLCLELQPLRDLAPSRAEHSAIYRDNRVAWRAGVEQRGLHGSGA